MTREEEQKLVEQVREGRQEAFEKLVLENQTRVYNLALKLTGNEQDAFDMSQEAFIKAYSSLDSFRGDSRFSVWLYRLTTNVCLDFMRASARRQHGSLSFEQEDGEETVELEIPDDRFSPERLAERRELRDALARGMKLLPEGYRVILFLREIDGLSYEEIGQALAMEKGTVKSRIFRARKRLCEILMADGNFSPGMASKDRKEG